VLHEDKGIVLKAKEFISEWLKKIGLELKPEKTRLGHTLQPEESIKPGSIFLASIYDSSIATIGKRATN
jgi:hypothetical protein